MPGRGWRRVVNLVWRISRDEAGVGEARQGKWSEVKWSEAGEESNRKENKFVFNEGIELFALRKLKVAEDEELIEDKCGG